MHVAEGASLARSLRVHTVETRVLWKRPSRKRVDDTSIHAVLQIKTNYEQLSYGLNRLGDS